MHDGQGGGVDVRSPPWYSSKTPLFTVARFVQSFRRGRYEKTVDNVSEFKSSRPAAAIVWRLSVATHGQVGPSVDDDAGGTYIDFRSTGGILIMTVGNQDDVRRNWF